MAFDWGIKYFREFNPRYLCNKPGSGVRLLITFARVERRNKSDLGEFANPGMSNVFTRMNGQTSLAEEFCNSAVPLFGGVECTKLV